jgi:DNA-binding NarL/FixJ family response regulator
MLQTPHEMSKQVGVESARKIRVVIVEKHAAVRRALRKRLSASPNLEVIAAVQEPAAALPYLHPTGISGDCPDDPHVIVLGLQKGSDEELYDTIRIVQQMVRCPAAVIVLAPYADEVERLLLQQAGVCTYLLKYIDSPRLIQEIEAAAAGGRASIVNA